MQKITLPAVNQRVDIWFDGYDEYYGGRVESVTHPHRFHVILDDNSSWDIDTRKHIYRLSNVPPQQDDNNNDILDHDSQSKGDSKSNANGAHNTRRRTHKNSNTDQGGEPDPMDMDTPVRKPRQRAPSNIRKNTGSAGPRTRSRRISKHVMDVDQPNIDEKVINSDVDKSDSPHEPQDGDKDKQSEDEPQAVFETPTAEVIDKPASTADDTPERDNLEQDEPMQDKVKLDKAELDKEGLDKMQLNKSHQDESQQNESEQNEFVQDKSQQNESQESKSQENKSEQVKSQDKSYQDKSEQNKIDQGKSEQCKSDQDKSEKDKAKENPVECNVETEKSAADKLGAGKSEAGRSEGDKEVVDMGVAKAVVDKSAANKSDSEKSIGDATVLAKPTQKESESEGQSKTLPTAASIDVDQESPVTPIAREVPRPDPTVQPLVTPPVILAASDGATSPPSASGSTMSGVEKQQKRRTSGRALRKNTMGLRSRDAEALETRTKAVPPSANGVALDSDDSRGGSGGGGRRGSPAMPTRVLRTRRTSSASNERVAAPSTPPATPQSKSPVRRGRPPLSGRKRGSAGEWTPEKDRERSAAKKRRVAADEADARASGPPATRGSVGRPAGRPRSSVTFRDEVELKTTRSSPSNNASRVSSEPADKVSAQVITAIAVDAALQSAKAVLDPLHQRLSKLLGELESVARDLVAQKKLIDTELATSPTTPVTNKVLASPATNGAGAGTVGATTPAPPAKQQEPTNSSAPSQQNQNPTVSSPDDASNKHGAKAIPHAITIGVLENFQLDVSEIIGGGEARLKAHTSLSQQECDNLHRIIEQQGKALRELDRLLYAARGFASKVEGGNDKNKEGRTVSAAASAGGSTSGAVGSAKPTAALPSVSAPAAAPTPASSAPAPPAPKTPAPVGSGQS